MRWPNGASCAVWFSFDFDAETLWLSRDPKNAQRLATLSMGRYGAQVGVPKLLELMAEEAMPATFFVPGWTADHHPDKLEAILRAGHEVGHHGYDHHWPDFEQPEQVASEIHRGLEALARFGVRPTGYRAPGGESCAQLLTLLRDEGFLYQSSFKDDIVPYRHVLGDGSKGIIEVPENPSIDDTAYGLSHLKTPRPYFGKNHVLEIWQDEFLQTRAWGGVFVLVLHPQVSGRPLRYAILREFIAFLRGFDDIWFATGAQIATHFAAQEAVRSSA